MTKKEIHHYYSYEKNLDTHSTVAIKPVVLLQILIVPKWILLEAPQTTTPIPITNIREVGTGAMQTRRWRRTLLETTEPRPTKTDGRGELTDKDPWDASSPPVGLARWRRNQHLKISSFYLKIRSSSSSYKIRQPDITGHTFPLENARPEQVSPAPLHLEGICSVCSVSHVMPISLALSS